MITLTVNGQERFIERECTLAAALAELGCEGKPLLVELNGEAVLRGEWPERTVRHGDRLELVQIVAGG